MNWLKKLFGGGQPELRIEAATVPLPKKGGMPIYEDGIQFQKLERREITVTYADQKLKLPINVICSRFHAGTLPGDASVLVTNFSWGEIGYCGEANVAKLVDGWQTAPLERTDAEDISRMIGDFGFPETSITTKAAYADLKSLYSRCDAYYRFILRRDKDFKRITKQATMKLVLLLDEAKSGWDEFDGEQRFAEAVRAHYPKLIRSEGEKKIRKEKAREKRLLDAEKQPLTDTRNLLTRFPHKDLQIEIQNIGFVEIRAIKEKLRDGTVNAETLVRFTPTAEWRALLEFLDDWVKNKATINQIRYLRTLQSRSKIKAEIRIDSTKEEMSARIDALAEKGETYG